MKPAVSIPRSSPADLVAMQRSSNEWLVRMARWELRERAWKGEDLSSALPAWEKLAAESDPVLALNAHSTLLALRSVKGDSKPFTDPHTQHYAPAALLAEKRPDVLARLIERELIAPLVYRNSLREKFPAKASSLATCEEQEAALLQLAGKSLGQRVRLALAEALPHLATEPRSLIAQHLLRYDQDATDHNLPLLVWTGIRTLPPSELIHCAHVCRIPLVTKLIARRITEASGDAPALLNTFLEKFTDRPETQTQILNGMSEAMRGLRKAVKPPVWERFIAMIPKTETVAWEQIRQLNVLFGDGQAMEEIRHIALDEKALTEQRRTALVTLVEANDAELKSICENLLSVRGLIMEAVRGLTRFDHDGVAKRIISRYAWLDPHERPQAIMALVSRPRFAADLLGAIEQGKIPKADLGPSAARQVRSFNDPKLNALLASVWGETRETPADKLQLVAELKARHTADFLAKADRSQGRLLYSTVCGQCHKLYGEGSDLGPDLTGSGRHDLNYLIENIVDPSGVVDAAYYLNNLTLRDGRVLSGVISTQTERTLTLRAIGQESVIDKGEIRSHETLPVSLMPEGLLQSFSAEQQRDLFAYLMGNTQVPLPK